MRLTIFMIVLLLIGCSDSNNPASQPPINEQDQYFTITLAWDDNNDPQVIGYALYHRNNTSDKYIWATSINDDDPLIVTLNFDKSLATNWYFVVTAYSITQESSYSNEVYYENN